MNDKRLPRKCLHCDYMRRPIMKEIPTHGWAERWEYCPTHGVYSDWDTELPDYMKRKTENEVIYCPQCSGITKDAPKQVVWHKNCLRCKTTWFINEKGTWEPYNSKFKKKYRKQSVDKKQREFKKRHEK